MNNSLFNHSRPVTILLPSEEQALIDISNYINNIILPAMLMYMMPPTILISFINNIFAILIFIFNKQVTQKITSSVRIYYIAISIADISDTISLHLRYFLGSFKNIFSLKQILVNNNLQLSYHILQKYLLCCDTWPMSSMKDRAGKR